jgi:type IV secretory pathway TrbD component
MRVNPVHRVLNKPLTVCGAERRHFLAALTLGAASWTLFSTLLGGIVVFLVLFAVARHVTVTDSKIPYILLRSGKYKAEYDPRKHAPVCVRILRSHA